MEPTPVTARGTRPLLTAELPPDLGRSARLSPTMKAKLKALIAKLTALLSSVPPALRGKVMALIAQAEAALAGFFVGSIWALIASLEQVIDLLEKLEGLKAELRRLMLLGLGREQDAIRRASAKYYAKLETALNAVGPQDRLVQRPTESSVISSLEAMISARFQ